jgi:hypothetical protein
MDCWWSGAASTQIILGKPRRVEGGRGDMGNSKVNPLDAALKRLESILGQASISARAAYLVTLRQQNAAALGDMIAREPVIRDAISEICTEWIETGKLNWIKDEDAQYFYDRLYYGEKMGLWLRSGDFQSHSKSADEILGWLLIDSWELVCLPLWKNELLDYD